MAAADRGGKAGAWARGGARVVGLACAVLAQAMWGTVAQAAEKRPLRLAPAAQLAAAADDDGQARVMVKYRAGSALAREAAGVPRHAQRLGRQMALPLEDGQVLGPRSQSLRARGISAAALAARLAQNPEVEWAEPVRRKHIRAVEPNDPYFGPNQTSITPVVGQWYLRAPDATAVSAINALGAWAVTTGSPSLTVAVLDTGVRDDHPDLAGKLWPGYDFVSRSNLSNDGGGRDADANDPGDWSTAADSCGASNSSWHGTQVAGLIGAATDNGIGMAGVGRQVMVLPVRVLGRCGGFDDDIIAGMRWAGGLSNSAACNSALAAGGAGSATLSATCNPRPARVLNISLGSSGACSAGYSEAITELNAAGVVVVVASGNDAGRAVNEPANCSGALAVAGIRHAGTKVGYSNLGPQIAIAAPAGNCVNLSGPCLYPLLTTLNSGSTTPGASVYSDSNDSTLGTSFATPLVAGSVGLLLSLNPALTPAQVKTTLQATARAFPGTGAQEPGTVACQAPGNVDQIECYCTTSTCGAGMLDVGAAVTLAQQALLAPTARITASTTAPTVGSPVTLDAAASTASSGRSLAAYRWQLASGGGLVSFIGATDGSSVTLATSAAGTAEVSLTVTDSTGATHTTTQAITVSAASVVVTPPAAGGGGGGGGGALGLGWLLGLAAAVGLLTGPGSARRQQRG